MIHGDGLMEFWVACLNSDCLTWGPVSHLAIGGKGSLAEKENKAKADAVLMWNEGNGAAHEVDLLEKDELLVEDRHTYDFRFPWPPATLKEIERDYIWFVSQKLRGDKKKIAEALGVSLKTVYNKLNGMKFAQPTQIDT